MYVYPSRNDAVSVSSSPRPRGSDTHRAQACAGLENSSSRRRSLNHHHRAQLQHRDSFPLNPKGWPERGPIVAVDLHWARSFFAFGPQLKRGPGDHVLLQFHAVQNLGLGIRARRLYSHEDRRPPAQLLSAGTPRT